MASAGHGKKKKKKRCENMDNQTRSALLWDYNVMCAPPYERASERGHAVPPRKRRKSRDVLINKKRKGKKKEEEEEEEEEEEQEISLTLLHSYR